MINTLRPTQDGCHFADDTFKRIFLNENVISTKISLSFVWSEGQMALEETLSVVLHLRRDGNMFNYKKQYVVICLDNFIQRSMTYIGLHDNCITELQCLQSPKHALLPGKY